MSISLWKNASVLLITLFLLEIAIHVVDPSIPFLFLHQDGLFQGASDLQTQKAYYAIFIAIGDYLIFIGPIFGYLSDMLSRKWMLIISASSCVIMGLTGIIGLLFHAPLFFLIFFTIGSSFYVYKMLSLATINNLYHGQLGQYRQSSLVQFFIGVGVMIGSLIGGYIASFTIFSTPYLLPYLIMFVVGMGVILTLYYAFHTIQLQEKQAFTQHAIQTLWAVIKKNHSPVLWICSILIIDQIAWGDFYQYIPSQLKLYLNVPTTTMGEYMAIIAFSLMAFSGGVYPLLLKRINIRLLLLICSILMVIGYIAFFIGLSLHTYLHDTSYGLWILSAVCIAGADVMLFTTLLVMGTQLFPKDLQGLATSVIYVIAKTSWIISGTISGFILYFSSSNTLFPGFIAACVLTVVVFIAKIKNKLITPNYTDNE